MEEEDTITAAQVGGVVKHDSIRSELPTLPTHPWGFLPRIRSVWNSQDSGGKIFFFPPWIALRSLLLLQLLLLLLLGGIHSFPSTDQSTEVYSRPWLLTRGGL